MAVALFDGVAWRPGGVDVLGGEEKRETTVQRGMMHAWSEACCLLANLKITDRMIRTCTLLPVYICHANASASRYSLSVYALRCSARV